MRNEAKCHLVEWQFSLKITTEGQTQVGMGPLLTSHQEHSPWEIKFIQILCPFLSSREDPL